MSSIDPVPSTPETEPPRRSGFFLYVVPAALYVSAIFYGGMVAKPPIATPRFSFADKIAHAFAFGFMVFVLYRALTHQVPRLAHRRALVMSVGLAALLGAALEFAQMLTPTRSAELLDWVADVLGAILAAVLIDRLSLASSSTTS